MYIRPVCRVRFAAALEQVHRTAIAEWYLAILMRITFCSFPKPLELGALNIAGRPLPWQLGRDKYGRGVTLARPVDRSELASNPGKSGPSAVCNTRSMWNTKGSTSPPWPHFTLTMMYNQTDVQTRFRKALDKTSGWLEPHKLFDIKTDNKTDVTERECIQRLRQKTDRKADASKG